MLKRKKNKLFLASQNKAEHGDSQTEHGKNPVPLPVKPDKVYCSACGHLGKIGEGQCRHPSNVIDAPWVPGRKIYPPTVSFNKNGGCKDFEKHIQPGPFRRAPLGP